MTPRLERLRTAIRTNHPKSRLKPVTAREMARLLAAHPKMPAHLRDFFAHVGCGSIGDSRYMIYPLIEPSDVFDPTTAAALEGIVLAGDDFAGTHEAYETRGRSWRFGTVSPSGTFRPCKKPKDFVAFIAHRYGGAAAE